MGGKARSVNVRGTNILNKDKYLPREHGFRFFPEFYKHVTGTMKRIPFKNTDGTTNKNGVFDNLTHTTEIALTRYDMPTIKILANFPKSLKDFELLFHDIFGGIHTGLTQEEKSFFVKRIWQLMISCEERKNQEYEKISWWKFLEADRFSDAGLDAAAVGRFLQTKDGVDALRQEEARGRQLGIRGVPYFVLNGKTVVSGAQPVETFVEAIAQARA